MIEGAADGGIEVAKSVVAAQAKGQLRVWLAMLAGAIAGSAFGHRYLPASLFSEPVLDAVAALIVYAVASAWTWGRVQLQHARWWGLAISQKVPDEIVRPAGERK
jgi:hypothetical protein